MKFVIIFLVVVLRSAFHVCDASVKRGEDPKAEQSNVGRSSTSKPPVVSRSGLVQASGGGAPSLRVHVLQAANGVRQRRSPAFRALPDEEPWPTAEADASAARGAPDRPRQLLFDIGAAAGHNIETYVVRPLVSEASAAIKDPFQRGFRAGRAAGARRAADSPEAFARVRYRLPGNVRNLFQLCYNLGEAFGDDARAAEIVDATVADQAEDQRFVAFVAYQIGAYAAALRDAESGEGGAEGGPPAAGWTRAATHGITDNARGLFNLGYATAGEQAASLADNLSGNQKFFYNAGYNFGVNFTTNAAERTTL